MAHLSIFLSNENECSKECITSIWLSTILNMQRRSSATGGSVLIIYSILSEVQSILMSARSPTCLESKQIFFRKLYDYEQYLEHGRKMLRSNSIPRGPQKRIFRNMQKKRKGLQRDSRKVFKYFYFCLILIVIFFHQTLCIDINYI